MMWKRCDWVNRVGEKGGGRAVEEVEAVEALGSRFWFIVTRASTV